MTTRPTASGQEPLEGLPDILTTGDVAAFFQVQRGTVRTWDQTPAPFLTPGGHRPHRKKDLAAFPCTTQSDR